MFDETTDLSHESLLTLIVRYVYEGNIREDVLQFLNPRDDDDKEIEDCENDVTESTVTGVDLVRMEENNFLPPYLWDRVSCNLIIM